MNLLEVDINLAIG